MENSRPLSALFGVYPEWIPAIWTAAIGAYVASLEHGDTTLRLVSAGIGVFALILTGSVTKRRSEQVLREDREFREEERRRVVAEAIRAVNDQIARAGWEFPLGPVEQKRLVLQLVKDARDVLILNVGDAFSDLEFTKAIRADDAHRYWEDREWGVLAFAQLVCGILMRIEHRIRAGEVVLKARP